MALKTTSFLIQASGALRSPRSAFPNHDPGAELSFSGRNSTASSRSVLRFQVDYGKRASRWSALSESCLIPSQKTSSGRRRSRLLVIAGGEDVPEERFVSGNYQSQRPTLSSPPTPASPPATGVTSIITRELYDKMLPHRGNRLCEGAFYTYDAFITAANSFPEFGTVGDEETRKRELAAFFGQTSRETTGGGKNAPDRYSWGYYWIRQRKPPSDYCRPSEKWPCVPGRAYYGRGPVQLTFNFNYGQAGEALGVDLLSNPDLVATDPVICFKASIWFWMTPQPPKPSCHDVMIGKWTPSEQDLRNNRLPGFGLLTNIINPGECGHGYDERVHGRIGFYKKYCDMLGVFYGCNLDCYTQKR
ncbi:endochitinase-like [Aristolochia californica]|uniref:endochitinase-like n=1 Tax=Aristolochia californica TaxID=171875 RepID=UPI0035E217B7